MTPDERALRAELSAPPFASQVDVLWGHPLLRWPFMFIRLTAREIQGSPITGYWVRINCAGFPAPGPTGTFWDMDLDMRLSADRRPWGEGEVALVFRMDWPDEKYGGHGAAFYTPADRVALDTHQGWDTQFPAAAWTPDKGIAHYLHEISRLLHSTEYTGPRGS